MQLSVVVAVLLQLAASAQGQALPNFIGQVSFPDPPAFLELYVDENPSDPIMSQSLYISTFNPLGLFNFDNVYHLRGPGQFLRDPEGLVAAMSFEEEGNNWANNPEYLPSSVVGREGVLWTSGFLVPGKTHGRLNMYFTDQGGFEASVNIAENDIWDWSYHRVVWKDVDSDGDIDCVTARFHTSLIGEVTKDFSWLENPGGEPTGNWAQHNISKGPDVHFRNMLLPGPAGDLDVFVAGEFWNRRMVVWYTLDNNWGDINIEYNVEFLEFDAPGQVFDLYVDDFNRDGREDILATVYDGEEGFVYVYEIPDDWMNEPWTRHTIARDFRANFIFGGESMTPGSPKPFYPSAAYENSTGSDGRQLKPYISVSGDDDGCLYILTSDSEAADDWSYTKNLLVNSTQTTSGKMAIGDMDNDGYTDIIGAAYTAQTLYFYTYAPLD